MLMETSAHDVNQLKAVLNKDNQNNLTLCTSVIPMPLTYARNWPLCSYVVLVSSPVNFEKPSTLKPLGYRIVPK
jgi:hypothetical protein